MNWPAVFFTTFFCVMRIMGEKGNIFKDCAHVYVGMLIAAAYVYKVVIAYVDIENNIDSLKMFQSRSYEYFWMVVILLVVEVGCFVVQRFILT